MIHIARKTVAATLFATTLNATVAGALDPTVDDFSDPNKNSLGIDRMFIDDTTAGGKTQTQYDVEGGVFSAKGDIVPSRGQPGCIGFHLCGAYQRNKTRGRGLLDELERPDEENVKLIQAANEKINRYMAAKF